jgi:KTSC domain
VQLVPPAIPSSNIAAMGYMQSTGEMQIRFLDGMTYSYANVPLEVYTQCFNGSILDPKEGRLSVGHTCWALGVTNKKAPQYSFTRLGYTSLGEQTPEAPSELPPFVQTATEVAAGVAETGTQMLGDALQSFTEPVTPPEPIATPEVTNPEGLPPTL